MNRFCCITDQVVQTELQFVDVSHRHNIQLAIRHHRLIGFNWRWDSVFNTVLYYL